MQNMDEETIDVVFADPPYFLSNGGKSISSGKVVSVDKGEWDKKRIMLMFKISQKMDN